jgi:hypothetical protein
VTHLYISQSYSFEGIPTELLDFSLEELSSTFSLLLDSTGFSELEDTSFFSELEDSSTFTELEDSAAFIELDDSSTLAELEESSTFAELLLDFALLLDTLVSLLLDCGVTLDEDSSQSSQMLDEERIASLETGVTF